MRDRILAQLGPVSPLTPGNVVERYLDMDPGRDFTCAERCEYLHEDCTEPATSP